MKQPTDSSSFDLTSYDLTCGARALTRRSLAGLTLGALALPRVALAQTATPAPSTQNQNAVINVSQAQTAPIPIALPVFAAASGEPAQLAANITGVISNDLVHCGLFRAINPASFIQTSVPPNGVPDFSNWKAIGAQALVTGNLALVSGDKLRVAFRLWNVLPGTQLQGTLYTTATTNWRSIAHIIADDIYQRLLGEKGYFDTRIAYISTTGPQRTPIKRLAIMDQDGANNRFLTSGRWMALSPRFNPKQPDQIAFLSFYANRPHVYLFNLSTGARTILGDFPGMTFAPRFSPDGTSIIMSVTHGGGSDIVTYNLLSRQTRRLTNSGAIDVSPCYSPDGTKIVFNSDRDGDQQLFVMNADGSNVRRISFGRGRYGTPVWSPRGDLIAFTRIGSEFAIGVMQPDGSGERILSTGWLVEGPTFCPNGSVLMFWRQTPARNSYGAGFSQSLVSIGISGFNEQIVETPTNASDPAWSPLLS